MALNFKQTARKPKYRKQPRQDKAYKEWKGRHMPTRKLIGKNYVGSYGYVQANIERWLYSQVDRPIDKVFSDFVKEFKKSYRGDYSPSELFYDKVDRERRETVSHWGNKFYVSESGFLCRYSKYKNVPRETYKRRRQPNKFHKDHNVEVLKGIKIGTFEQGPKYIGKMWVRAKGVTKLLNTWLVRDLKLQGKRGYFSASNISKAEKYNLSLYTPAIVEGVGSSYMVDHYSSPILRGLPDIYQQWTYNFIVKLSDIKIWKKY